MLRGGYELRIQGGDATGSRLLFVTVIQKLQPPPTDIPEAALLLAAFVPIRWSMVWR